MKIIFYKNLWLTNGLVKTPLQKEMDEANVNFYIKYGDLPYHATAQDVLMKQKHRMVWERRHGPVGTGMQGSEFRERMEKAKENGPQ